MPKQQKKTATAERVRAAFEAARQGDLQPSAELADKGRAVIPYVAPYVKDKNADVRRQAVAILGALGGKAALAPLVQALNDAEPGIQEAAALAIYDGYAPQVVAAEAGAGTALRKAARGGAMAPAIPLLVGYFPGRASVEALEALKARNGEMKTKMRPWSALVPLKLPVLVGLSRLGADGERKALLEAIEAATQEELEFLLDALRDVDAPEVLHSLARTLDDTRPVEGRVPSGVEPKPRLCDVAVNAFLRRLKLKTGFEPNNAIQFTPEQIEKVRAALRSSVPR